VSFLSNKELMPQKEELVVKIGENAEEFDGGLETVTREFQAPVKGFPGGTAAAIGKDIVEIAAPKSKPRIEPGGVPGNPAFPSPDPLAHQQQGGRGLADGLHNRRFLLPLKGGGKTAHDVEMGEGLTDIAFGFSQDLQFPPKKEDGKPPVLQEGKEADHKIKGHVADSPLPGEKTNPPYNALTDGDDQGGVLYKIPVLPVMPGPEQVRQRKKDQILSFPPVQKFIDDGPQLLVGYNINRDL
jgi:hypothetical protein